MNWVLILQLIMTIREIATAKLQQLPDPLLQQVNDFIDFLAFRHLKENVVADDHQSACTEVWADWFESVDRLEIGQTDSVESYQHHLLSKYRQQGVEL